MPKEFFICQECDYETDRRGKLDRHLDSLKHQIQVQGITCCDLTYYDKHRYINHKRSEKHRMREKGIDIDHQSESTTTVKLTSEELKASAKGQLGCKTTPTKKSLNLSLILPR